MVGRALLLALAVMGCAGTIAATKLERIELQMREATVGDRMDGDYLQPAFFGNGERLLMLADHGSEDSWGLIVLDVAPAAVRDHGEIDVVRPGNIDFTESALPVAEVFFEDGGYVVKFRGEVIASPGDAPTQWLAKRGQRAVFVQTGQRFRYAGAE